MRPKIFPDWNLETIQEYTRPQEDGCMEWKGGAHKQGYAMMRYKKQMRTVHSVIAELKYGERPTKYNGTRVTRTCGNPMCVNPEHIFIDSSSAIQHRRIKEMRKKSKFSIDDVKELRRKYKEDSSWGRIAELAREYKINHNHCAAILYRRLYKWVD